MTTPSENDLPADLPGPTFAEPWQADAFALAIALNRKQAFGWSDWVGTFSQQPAPESDPSDQSIEREYYLRWLSALETLAVEQGLVSAEEMDRRVEEWRRAYLRTPHGQPIELARGIESGDADDHDHEAHHHHDHDEDDHHHAHAHSRRPEPVTVSPAVTSRAP
jgi:nitrile hydratase accessory protein